MCWNILLNSNGVKFDLNKLFNQFVMKDHIFSIKLKDNLLLQNMEQNRARLMGKNLPQNCFILTDLLVIGPDRLYCSHCMKIHLYCFQ